ncbi:helix-turn-helix domain-containing protein [Flammeovirga sp. OC4]|uniref:helix-turn-helix domain-containing protein n=1 Tax=Flammeovirga sp. OC4 TaxID=1382345 RepID=UPI0005C734E5|nr:AraC family transcriptional regulator [Flammeovirga sp. OC4]
MKTNNYPTVHQKLKIYFSVFLNFITYNVYCIDYDLPKSKLSNSVVYSILEDHKGNMWVGNIEGLNQYDGTNLSIINSQNHLPDKTIRNMVEDDFQRLWLGTDRGLFLFHPRKNNFTPFLLSEKKSCKKINTLQLSNGILWVGTPDGIYLIEIKKKQTQHFHYYPLKDVHEISLHKDDRQKVWVASSEGLCSLLFNGTIKKTERKNNNLFQFTPLVPVLFTVLLIGIIVFNKNQKGAQRSTHKIQTSTYFPTPQKEPSLTSNCDREFLDKMYQIILTEIDNPNFSVEQLEKKMGMSHANFYRKVKLLTGKTAKNVMQDFRMKEASRLLKTKKYRVSEVAYMTGFNDPKYFTKCFKKQYGELPSQFA